LSSPTPDRSPRSQTEPGGEADFFGRLDRVFSAYLKLSGDVIRAVAVAVLAFMVAINALEVAWRGITRGGLGWTQELSIIVAMAIYFFAYALIAKDDDYIRVEALYKILPDGFKRLLAVVIRLLVILFHAMVLVFALWTIRFAGMFQTSVLQWPESVFYVPLAAGAFDIVATESIYLFRHLTGRQGLDQRRLEVAA
jgi:TRAP-type C4-dicarboxylate transport system permease small subunit